MSKLTHKKITPGISLKAIELLKSSIEMPNAPDLSFNSFSFSINIENKADSRNKLLFSIVSIEIKSEDQHLTLGSIALSCIYTIDNFDELIKTDEEQKLNIPKQLTENINGLAISTTRGVMFSTYKGTFLHNAFLPLIDLRTLQLEEMK